MNKVALITGGAKRVGRAVAINLAKAGMDIAFTWHTSENETKSLEQEITGLGQKVLAIQVDVSQPNAVEIIVEKLTQKFKRLDALINSASCFESTTMGSVTVQQFEQTMAINARFPLMLTQALAPLLAENYSSNKPHSTGRVINFIDTHVLGEPLRGYISYNTTKAALREITSSCALELAPEITVNAIAPGVVAWASFYTEEKKKEYLERVPLGRVGTADEAASAVRFLVQDAHYCTGQIIKIDGGRHLT